MAVGIIILSLHIGAPAEKTTLSITSKILENGTSKIITELVLKIKQLGFWPGLGLPSQRPILSYQKVNLCQNINGKKLVKVRSTTCHLATKKRPVTITVYLGLEIIIKLKFTTDFDRCAILNILNYLIKNFEF